MIEPNLGQYENQCSVLFVSFYLLWITPVFKCFPNNVAAAFLRCNYL